jgi:hypothetical protein
MKKHLTISVILLWVVFFTSSCSEKILFTNEMRYKLHENHLDIGKVQFYNSKKIVLKRNLTYDETKVAQGKIRFENGEYTEEIIIPKNTPGVAVGEGQNYLNIAFERGNDRYLKFLKNMDDHFQLSAKNWDNNGYGRVSYDSSVYYILPGGDKALLKVSKDNLNNSERKTRKVKGVKITN